MTTNKSPDESIDWSRATYEGAIREAMRRWSQLPLEKILAAQEEMAELAQAFGHSPSDTREDDGDAVTPAKAPQPRKK